jgi:dihydroflavonol-4-reductase
VPKDENELLRPAREGALRVLRASRDAGVRRVVLTSSFAAIGYGHAQGSLAYDEAVWTNLDGNVAPYTKSKTVAERAAWDFMAREGGALELAVVNPVAVFGPVLGPDFASSIFLLKSMLDGKIPAFPRMPFGIVDVRDVADLHLRAMTNPAAKGERFLATAGDFLVMLDVAKVLKRRLGATAKRVSTRELPDWAVRLAAPFIPAMRARLPELGKVKNATSEKARRLLGWAPRPAEDAIVAAAESLVRYGLVKAG